jgi:hypothetical protein
MKTQTSAKTPDHQRRSSYQGDVVPALRLSGDPAFLAAAGSSGDSILNLTPLAF